MSATRPYEAQYQPDFCVDKRKTLRISSAAPATPLIPNISPNKTQANTAVTNGSSIPNILAVVAETVRNPIWNSQ